MNDEVEQQNMFSKKMQDGQSARIQGVYRDMDLPPIEVLDIEDKYEYLDNELIALLTERINSTLKLVYKI